MVQGNGAHGGYRRPTNPAQLSGPGQFARRTDGQPSMAMPDAKYGEAATFHQIQQGAPMAGGASMPSGGGGGGADPFAALTGMMAPSSQPGVPVTDGAAAGPGAGPEALGLPQDPQQMDMADAESLRPVVQAMVLAASQPRATASYKNLVRKVLQNLR